MTEPTPEPTPLSPEVKALIEGQNQTFADFKTAFEAAEQKMVNGLMTAEDREKIEKIQASFLDFETKLAGAIADGNKAIETRMDGFEGKLNKLGEGGDGGGGMQSEERKMFDKFCRQGEQFMSPEERKTFILGDNTTGGFGAPKEFATELIKILEETSPFRPLISTGVTSQKAVQWAKRTTIVQASRRRQEVLARTDSTGSYGGEEVTVPEMYVLAKATNADLEDTAFNLEQDLMEQFAIAIAQLEGAEWVNGIGMPKEYEGILTPAGVTVVPSGAVGALTPDAIKVLVYDTIKTDYYNRGSFIFNLKTLGAIMKLKDDNSNYLWQPAIAGGPPATLEGKPYTLIPDMPDVANDAKVIGFGDWKSAYKLRDRSVMPIQRINEHFIETGEIGFLMVKRTGAIVVLDEAYGLLQIDSS